MGVYLSAPGVEGLSVRECVFTCTRVCLRALRSSVHVHASVRVFAFMWEEEAIYFDCFQ